MAVTKSAHRAIEEFVEAIAQHYLEVKSKAGDESVESVAEEFVSAVEIDLRSTLRDRLSQLETKRDAAETPTAEWSADELDAAVGHDADPTQVTGYPSVDPDDHSDIGVASNANIDAPTLDSDSLAPSLNSGPVVRSGIADPSGELSYDEPTMDERSGPVEDDGRLPKAPPEYQILDVLGKGGMGVVYRAKHLPLNRVVAVKMIISGAHASEEQIQRFQREAEAAAHLKHPNIVAVYEVGLHEGLPYFSLEFVEGESLSQLMKQTTLSPRRAAELLIPVARAVHYSHQMGVLHRDLKPQNILMTQDGQPKVADFGLAKRLDDEGDENKTREGVVLGTPGYMAPEQARSSDRVGPHSDVYAMGSILYYLMTGRPPFAAPTPFETVRQMLLQDPVVPSRLQMGLDRDLETICLKTLEKDIERRYATAEEFADELQRFVDGKPIVARPISRRERLWKWCRRNPRLAWVSGAAASLLLCLTLGGIISAIVIDQQKKAEQAARRDAEANEQRAIEQGALAADTTRLLLYKTKDFFEQNPQLRKLREPLMEAVVEGADEIYVTNEKYNVNDVFTASADAQLGQIYLEAGAFEKARDKLLKAEKQLTNLTREGEISNSDVSQMNITMALGDAYRLSGEMQKAETSYLSLEQQRRDYFQRNPQFGQQLAEDSMAEVYGKLATTYRLLGQPDKALHYNLKTVGIRRATAEQHPTSQNAQADLAGALTQLSSCYENAGLTEKMLAASSEALNIQMQLGKTRSDFAVRHNTAKDQKVLARQYLLLAQNDKAKKLLVDATTMLEELIELSDDQRTQNQAVESYFLLGLAQQRLGQPSQESYRRSESLQRAMMKTSDNVNARGMLLKILARSGQVEAATKLADELAQSQDKMMPCGYAACGYAMIIENLSPEDPRRAPMTTKAIDLTRRLIRHGYHDFASMRSSDLDFSPLQHNPEFLAMLDAEEKRLKDPQSPAVTSPESTQ